MAVGWFLPFQSAKSRSSAKTLTSPVGGRPLRGPGNKPRRVGDAQPEHVQPVLEVGDEGRVDVLDVGGHRLGRRRIGGERRGRAGRRDDRRRENEDKREPAESGRTAERQSA